MNRIIISAIGVLLFHLSLSSVALAGDEMAPDDSIWTRPTLLDGPGGPKQPLRDRGVAIEGWLTQTYAGIIEGDGTHDWQYGGKGTLTANFDGGKLGLWQGISLSVIQEWNFGEDSNSLGDGTLLPVDGITAFPRLGGFDRDTSIVATQSFGEAVSVSVGKFNLLHLVSKTPIVGGGGEETFLNAAIAGPITGVIPPYLVGAIANINTDAALFTIMVFDPRNAQDWDVVANPFEEGTSFTLAATVPTKIAGLTGYYGIRGVYSTSEGLDLSNIPHLVELPPGSSASLTKEGYWYVNLSAQQYLYEDPDHPGAGWGFFAYASISDGNPNPIEWTAYAGLGGNNPLWGRHLDKWGVAYFKYGMSDDLLRGLNTIGFPRQDEEGVEVFYNAAITPWFRLTADVQWIDPFRTDRDDVTLAILRAQTKF